jgi:hypothetical protein
VDPEHARLGTDVAEFWDDDDNTSVDFTPRWAHPDTVGAPGPSSRFDTNWWDGDSEDALWDATESDSPAHAPLRAVNAADTGTWRSVLEPRPPWYRARPAAIALIAAAAASLTIVVLAVGSPAADEQDPAGITPSRPSVASVEPAPSATAPPSAVAPPPPPPPAPSVEQISPPSGGGGNRPRPRTATPQETDKPRIDVTRAPMSVAPEPRTPPKTAAPGGNSGNGGGWPW